MPVPRARARARTTTRKPRGRYSRNVARPEDPTVVDQSQTVPKAMPQPVGHLAAGTLVGRYVVLGEIGEGGMGTVYRAYDPQLHREVALKRLRSQADEDGSARLIKEARAMARLSDPHVVAVHDVVVEDDGVTLAMELVEGGTLDEWLERRRPSAEIIARLLQAGRGLAAAHRAGMVHRDFKPGNVLVPPDGPAKVTDFGLVKTRRGSDPISHDPADVGDPASSCEDATDLTRHGTVLGTPRYAAPEQFADGHADARSDQFAFCVSAWRSLVGEPPFSGNEEALQAAKLAGPPTMRDGGTVSPRVARALERGLSPDPAQRWPDMETLLAELEPRSGSRRIGLLLGAVTLTGVVLAWPRSTSPCANVDTLEDLWSPARKQAIATELEATGVRYAVRAWEDLETNLDAYVERWRTQRREACEAVHLHATQTPAERDLRVGCLQHARARLAATIHVLETADADVVERAPNLAGDLPDLEACADTQALARGEAGAANPLGDEALEALREQHARAAALLSAGRYAEAADAAAEAWDAAAPLTRHPLRARIGRTYGAALSQSGRDAESLPIFAEALRVALASGADDVAARVAFAAAHALVGSGQHRERARWYAELGAGWASRPDAPAAARAAAADVMGQVERAAGNWDAALEHGQEALRIRIESLGEGHPDVAVSRNNIGLQLYNLDRPKEAIAPLRAAVETWREHYGDDHPEVGKTRNTLAMALQRAGHHEEALAEYRAALEVRTAALGERHPDTISSQYNLGLAMQNIGQYERAETNIRGALRQWQDVLPAEHPNLAIGHDALGNLLDERGQHAQSLVAHREALKLGVVAYGPEHPQMCGLYANLARSLIANELRDEAREKVDRALRFCEGELGHEHRFARRLRQIRDELGDPAELSAAP